MKPLKERRDAIINKVIALEGGYVNDPLDSGGETNYGITRTVAEGSGWSGSMRDFPREFAVEIYAEKYWDPLELNDVLDVYQSPRAAHQLFDAAVNCGVTRTAEWFQRCLNVLNQREKLWRDLRVDADIGAQTLDALSQLRRHRGGAIADGLLAFMLRALRASFYINLAERREKDERFIFGWLTRVAE